MSPFVGSMFDSVFTFFFWANSYKTPHVVFSDKLYFLSYCCTRVNYILKLQNCIIVLDLNVLLKHFQAPVCRAWNYGIRSCDQTRAGSPTTHTELYSNSEWRNIEDILSPVSLCSQVSVPTDVTIQLQKKKGVL